ncbi:histidine phosphatase family protein [Flavihumibacter sp. R14]|nr:histidine phosphatase family protein [Flavihumibacter soli]
MKRFTQPMAWLGFLFLLVSLSSASLPAKETVIYIVRHAEKDTSDPTNNNPDLNAEGKERAVALNGFLKKEKFAAVFSTPYKRTMQTASPVAQRNGVPVKSYKDSKEVAELVKSEFANQKILIAGHSNTILEIVKAFGATPPFETLNDDDYDLIFMVRISKDGEVSLKTQRFGKPHHSSPIPEIKSVP